MRVVVAEWRPPEACQLQQAMRLTNEAFAEKLGAAPRTIAKWHANSAMRLTLEMQQALDTMLDRAGDDVKHRFAQLRGDVPDGQGRERSEPLRRRLDADRHIASALDWLDGIRHEPSGISRRDVEALLGGVGAARVREGARARGTVDRSCAAQVVRDFYGDPPPGYGNVSVHGGPRRHATTILSRKEWLAGRLDLREETGAFELVHGMPADDVPVSPAIADAALQRVAEILVGRTRFVDAPVYRLLRAPEGELATGTEFAVDTFAHYALTWDVLEAEVADSALGRSEGLPLREALLPSIGAVLEPTGRLCAGGAQALCAFARPGAGGRPGDYLLLIQERSPRVVNATGRLAVIPKCFHQPINDVAGDVGVGRTLLRELEEELLGRDELDVGSNDAAADPMHPSRLSEPMRWLCKSPDWDLQMTGFGYNLMSGNYEFASVMAVHDETFWIRHGGAVEANWEAARLRAFSSLDRDGLAALLNEPDWSDEGLVAFALGLRRLAELSPDRVRLPPLEIGVQT
ncbi:hypothetical protein OO014_06160 [Intrasporangium calvum]|uniref:Transcriptional regulator n=1 Tax=Intrasporangium calvum TaxID=53358 RepID=A0ABT5GFZ9_9MICO|nr:hypothetical protein [Intrasporangium calvum]MDC5696836.1 hypothetical protein [Intrasporangium calvum]